MLRSRFASAPPCSTDQQRQSGKYQCQWPRRRHILERGERRERWLNIFSGDDLQRQCVVRCCDAEVQRKVEADAVQRQQVVAFEAEDPAVCDDELEDISDVGYVGVSVIVPEDELDRSTYETGRAQNLQDVVTGARSGTPYFNLQRAAVEGEVVKFYQDARRRARRQRAPAQDEYRLVEGTEAFQRAVIDDDAAGGRRRGCVARTRRL